MKKSKLLAAGLFGTLLVSSVLQAQNSSPYWSLAGNSNASTSSKLGTTNSIPLRLFTKNTTRIFIDTLGRVGIGTTPSRAKLEVNGVSGSGATSALFGGDGAGISLQRNWPTIGFNQYRNSTSGQGRYMANGYAALQTLDPTTGNMYFTLFQSGTKDGLTDAGHLALALTKNGNVGIGTATLSNGLTVGNGGIGGYNSTSGASGVYGSGDGTGVYGTSNSGWGVYGTSTNGYGAYGYSPNNYGVYGTSNNSSGIYGYTPGPYGKEAAGVYGYCNGYGYGVHGYSEYGTGLIGYGGTYGVYAAAASGVGNYAGFFAGPVFATTYSSSDRKLKKNIEDVGAAMDIIGKLQPKQYEYRQDGDYKFMHLPEGKHYGLIAQDLEQVLPTLVKDSKFDPNIVKDMGGIKQDPAHPTAAPKTDKAQPAEAIDFKAVNYTELIPIMIKGMQEQAELIKQQQQQINDLKQEVAQLKGNGFNTISGSGKLMQATPNPSSSTTRISYNLPAGVNQAQLLLTDAQGKIIKAISLNNSGTVDLNTGGLSSGVYNYSLLINGKIADTKKLVVAR